MIIHSLAHPKFHKTANYRSLYNLPKTLVSVLLSASCFRLLDPVSHRKASTSPALESLSALISTPSLFAGLSLIFSENLSCWLAKPQAEEMLFHQTKIKTRPFGVPPLFSCSSVKKQKASCLRTSDVTKPAAQVEYNNDVFTMIFKNQFGSTSHPSLDAASW